MSRKNRPQYHEPTNAETGGMAAEDVAIPIEDTLEVGDIVLVENPIDGTVEVGTVLLVDGPLDPAPLGAGQSGMDEFNPPRTSSGPMPDFGAAADMAKDKIGDAKDKGQDMAQNAAQTAGALADTVKDKADQVKGKAADAAQDVAAKAQDIAGKVSETVQGAAEQAKDKVQEAAQKIAGSASDAKDSAAQAGSKGKSAVAGAAGTVGMSLWTVIQRSPLQAIAFIASLVWLINNHRAAASQPVVSPADAAGTAAEKVGSLSGHVQVAAGTLGSQVSTTAKSGAGWFATTLQENPLVIGAMAIAGGLALGLAVPETAYEHKALGKTRDQLLDKATEAATDLGHKVQTVAQTTVHEAIETAKTEAKNQGLTPADASPAEPAPQEQSQQQ